MDKKAKKLRKDIDNFLKKYNDLFEDVTLYSQDEWQEREEQYGNDSILSMTFEGPFYEMINYGMMNSLKEEFLAIVEKNGFYKELSYAWAMHFYE